MGRARLRSAPHCPWKAQPWMPLLDATYGPQSRLSWVWHHAGLWTRMGLSIFCVHLDSGDGSKMESGLVDLNPEWGTGLFQKRWSQVLSQCPSFLLPHYWRLGSIYSRIKVRDVCLQGLMWGLQYCLFFNKYLWRGFIFQGLCWVLGFWW